MAKALKTAAMVVGAAALIVGTAGALAPVATTIALGSIGITASAAAIAAGLSLGAAVLSLAAGAVAPKGSLAGNATKFTIDKDSGLPIAIGRTSSGGRVVHRQYYGAKNALESWVTVHSLGPVKSLGPLQIDQQAVAFAGGAAQGSYAGFMWLDEQLGACPEARALAGPHGSFPGWNAGSKLSGLAADLWTLQFDSKGKVYPNGVPARTRVIEGMFVYDARQDSTYPGGNGPCRAGDESTYVWSENPACWAVTWAIGRAQNGTLMAGGGLAITGIDLAPFVEWSNVCDANGWKVGGIVFTTDDNSWDVLKMIAQAGGGEVLPVGALLSCIFSAPRVSIGTITSADICGDIDAPSSASRRTRRNTVTPRVRLESHGWEMVPLDAIAIPDYVAVDGGSRPKEIEYPLVQQVDQGAQLGLYDLFNARELDGIKLPCKVYTIGYRPGDCLTIDIPEADLVDRDVIVRGREIDGGTMGVTFTCRTETAGKHPFALGRGGKAPPTPDLRIPAIGTDAPQAGDWTLVAGGGGVPTLRITGAVGDPAADAVIFEYRQSGASDWIGAGTDQPGTTAKDITVAPDVQYEVAVSYRVRGVIGDRLVLSPVTSGAIEASAAGTATSAGAISDGTTTISPAYVADLERRFTALEAKFPDNS